MDYDEEHDDILTKVEKLCEKIPQVTAIADEIGIEKQVFQTFVSSPSGKLFMKTSKKTKSEYSEIKDKFLKLYSSKIKEEK